MRDVWRRAFQNFKKAHQITRKRYDAALVLHKFSFGDSVMLFNHSLSFFLEPFIIGELFNSSANALTQHSTDFRMSQLKAI